MKTIVLGGFLGTGKTSVLLQIARYCGARNIKTAIIENEIAKFGMDDQLIRSTGMRVETLFSNCICCTGAAEMTVMVNQLGKKYAPELILVEATGVAVPGAIKQNLLAARCCETIRTVVLVDASRFLRLAKAMPDMIAAQFDQADLILVNKIDVVGSETLDAVHRKVSEMHDAAQLDICAASDLPEACIGRIVGEWDAFAKK